jgi:hypothetical protein
VSYCTNFKRFGKGSLERNNELGIKVKLIFNLIFKIRPFEMIVIDKKKIHIKQNLSM